jgi:DNA mismatch repair protein MutS
MRDPAFDPPQESYDAGAVPPADAQATPSMAQYIEIKAANPDCLLFYRMGDFYELFFGDAEIAARVLGIVLTKRGKHAGADIPMCGVPVHRADEYLQRLIATGLRVAVCEQLEDPAEARKRGSKAVVKRDVVRIVTPGTITEEGLLDARRAHLLVSLARTKSASGWDYAIAACDVSGGAFSVESVGEADLSGEIARLDPSELLVPDAIREEPALAGLWIGARFSITRLARDGFDPVSAEKRVAGYFGVATLDAFGEFSRADIAAMGAIIAYLERTQLQDRPPLAPPGRRGFTSALAIDASTRANLELARTLSGQRDGSLLAAIDRTETGPGSRHLGEWLAAPSTDLAEIRARQESVATLVEQRELRAALRRHLKSVPDLVRAMTRLALDRSGPRDLVAIGAGLIEAGRIGAMLAHAQDLPDRLRLARDHLIAAPAELGADIRAVLAEDVPLLKRDGGFVRRGFDPVLDELLTLQNDSRTVIAGLQQRYAEATDTRSLRIKHNNQLGYFIEVPQQAGERMVQPPLNATFVHRQTMAGAMRFSTTELSSLESRIAAAAERAVRRELEHFAAFREKLLDADQRIRHAAAALALIDALAGLADIADRGGWVRPVVTPDLDFRIEGGRHPVVEEALRRQGESFIANPCDLSAEGASGRILLVTGANMAGKSTYLRQNALIAILAQIGSFVPATSARIGIVDRLFSRVGAADDLARGRSTFMVEMVETAAILNQSGNRALVILDEIGRGTATYDGLSIAWAAIEHLHDRNRCRALFATHFHELTALAGRLARLAPVTMKVATYKGDVVFLHEVIAGAADRSYGIQVARLAGLPDAVVKRAGSILAELEKADRTSPRAAILDELPLFRAAQEAAPHPGPDPLRAAIEALRPDEMSPREALEALYRLRQLIDGR